MASLMNKRRKNKANKKDDGISLSGTPVAETSTPPPSRTTRTRSGNNKGATSTRLHFEMRYMHVEDHKSPIYCVRFNHFLDDISVFACVAKNRVSIYKCETSGTLKFLQVYADSEEKEIFFTCAWSLLKVNDGNESILAVAGNRGVIRILAPKTMTCIDTGFMRHPGEINELKFHPWRHELLLSASNDLTIKLWNVKTSALIVSFGGVDGHRDRILSVDFNADGDMFVSSGMDHAIKFWNLDTEAIRDAVDRSSRFDVFQSSNSFQSHISHHPDHSTRDVHTSYIDCISWFGSLLISKSNDSVLKIWKPDLHSDNKLGPFQEFNCENCNLWFLKFSMNFTQKILALGNRSGKIFVWNLDTADPRLITRLTLTHLRSTSTIRHTALDREGLILIAVSDDGSIWRWDQELDLTKISNKGE